RRHGRPRPERWPRNRVHGGRDCGSSKSAQAVDGTGRLPRLDGKLLLQRLEVSVAQLPTWVVVDGPVHAGLLGQDAATRLQAPQVVVEHAMEVIFAAGKPRQIVVDHVAIPVLDPLEEFPAVL